MTGFRPVGGGALGSSGLGVDSGSLAASESADTASLSGVLYTGVTGTLARTEGADTAAFAGSVTSGVTAAMAASEARDRVSFAGTGGSASAGTAGSFFSLVVQALLRGDTVRACYGVTMNFASGPVSVWQGFGPLDAGAFAGPVFLGLGDFGKIGSIELGTSAPTQGLELELSGLNATFFAKSQNQSSEVRGRRCQLYMLFFDQTDALVDAGLLRTFTMDKIITDVSAANDPPTMICKLQLEPILATKNMSNYSFLTDADQRTRYPLDRGLERTQLLSNRMTLVW